VTDRTLACTPPDHPFRSRSPLLSHSLETPRAAMFKPVFHFLDRFGNVVGRTMMTIIYFVAVAPVALVYKLFTDALLVKKPPTSTYRPWSGINETLEDARRQD
jgi:hypothetical protein